MDAMAQLPVAVRALLVGLVALHVLAFLAYVFLLVRSGSQKQALADGLKKLKEMEMKARKGNKLE